MEFFKIEMKTSSILIVFMASKLLRERQYFQREDGTPLHYTLVKQQRLVQE